MSLQTALGVIGIIASIGGVIVAIYKLKPDSARIFVDSAKVSVEMADADRAEAKSDLAARTAERDRIAAEFAEYRARAEARDAGRQREIAELIAENQALRRVRKQQDGGSES